LSLQCIIREVPLGPRASVEAVVSPAKKVSSAFSTAFSACARRVGQDVAA
jgi:hypothetical protein